MIPDEIYDPSTEYKNLAKNYGETSINKIREFENTYLKTLTQSAQYFHMMYKCIMNLLSE